jgi:hypothetical protein
VKRESFEADSPTRAAAFKLDSIPIIIMSLNNGAIRFARTASGGFRIDRSRSRMEHGGRNCLRSRYKV